MPFAEINEVIPVIFGPENMEGELHLSQNFLGQVGLRIVSDDQWNESPLVVRSQENHVPSIRIDEGFITSSTFGPHPAETNILAVETVLMHRNAPPSETRVEVHFCLSGVIIFGHQDEPHRFTAGGRNWRLALLEGSSIDTQKRIQTHDTRLVTAELVAEEVQYDQIPQLQETADRLLLLLSFALGGMVRVARRDLSTPDGITLESHLYHIGRPEPFMLGPIPIDGPYRRLAAQYLEWCHDRLAAAEANFRLRNVLHLLVEARNTAVLELQALTVSLTLEVLRHYFSHAVMVPLGLAKDDGDDVLWPQGAPHAGKRIPFGKVHEALAAHHRLTHWETRFKKMRNEVVHTGRVPGNNVHERRQLIMDVMHYCDAAILAILEWDQANGLYIPCRQPLDPRPGYIGNNTIQFLR